MHLSNFNLITDVTAHGFGIALTALGIEWDLHNYGDFEGFEYSTTITDKSTLTLKWHMREGVIEWDNAHGGILYPSNRFCLVFSNVDHLEIAPRDPEMPSDEDKTLGSVSWIEASEDSEMYRDAGAVSCCESCQEMSAYHLGFRFYGGQFIRVGAEKAEFILQD